MSNTVTSKKLNKAYQKAIGKMSKDKELLATDTSVGLIFPDYPKNPRFTTGIHVFVRAVRVHKIRGEFVYP